MFEGWGWEFADAILAGVVIADEARGGATGAEIMEGLDDGNTFEITGFVDAGGDVDEEIVDVDDIGFRSLDSFADVLEGFGRPHDVFGGFDFVGDSGDF